MAQSSGSHNFKDLTIAGESRVHAGDVNNINETNYHITNYNYGGQAEEARKEIASVEEIRRESESLRQAAKHGDTKLIKALLDSEVSVDSRDEDGRTALSLAAQHGNIEAVRILLEHDAVVDTASNAVKRTNMGSGTGEGAKARRTALHWAAKRGHVAIVELLLAKNADLGLATGIGRTPALEAAVAGQFTMVKILLDHGADVNTSTGWKWTMLHEAVNAGRIEMAKELISRGTNTEIGREGPWKGAKEPNITATNQTALHYAVCPSSRPRSRETAMIELLIEQGKASISAQDSEGATPVHYAIRARWLEGLKALIKHATWADLEVRDSSGKTALTV